jgi:hypothetical protein
MVCYGIFPTGHEMSIIVFYIFIFLIYHKTLNKNSIMKTTQLTSIPLDKWMENLKDALASKPIKDICFPGTHDSGTYYLESALAPDAVAPIPQLWNDANLGNSTGIREYIKGMAVTQSNTIFDQLYNGIRYLDLRVCNVNDEFYTCHLLLGNKISVIVQDIKRFLDENTSEIVMVKVGFKKLTDDQEVAAQTLFKLLLDPYYEYGDASVFMNRTFGEQLASNKRALFLSGGIEGLYDDNTNDNSSIVNMLKSGTSSFKATDMLLEAQCFRPTSHLNYVLGYIQHDGCKLLPYATALFAVPFVGPILGAYGITTLASLVLYLKECGPVPTNLKENAANSVSIIKDYFSWLSGCSIKPTFVICDYFDKVPLVEIAIRINNNEPYDELIVNLSNADLRSGANVFTDVFKCGIDGIAAAFLLIGYACDEAAGFIKDNIPGVTGEAIAGALKNAGYASKEIAGVLNTIYNLDIDHVFNILKGLNYSDDLIQSALSLSFKVDVWVVPHSDTHVPPHGDTSPHVDTPEGPHGDLHTPSHIDGSQHFDTPSGPHFDQKAFGKHGDKHVPSHGDENPHGDTPSGPHGDSHVPPHADSNPHIDTPAGPHLDSGMHIDSK